MTKKMRGKLRTHHSDPQRLTEDEDTVLLLSEYDLGIASKMPLFKERLSVAETSFLASRLPS